MRSKDPGKRHNGEEQVATTTTIRLADEFRGNARFAAIESIFRLVDADASATEVWATASKVMQSLNGDERGKLSDLIKQALKDRGRSPRS